MTNKDEQLKDEIEKEEYIMKHYGDNENWSFAHTRKQLWEAELKGRQEARKEEQDRIIKIIDYMNSELTDFSTDLIDSEELKRKINKLNREVKG